MDAIMNFVAPELIVLVPVLYIIGMGMKRAVAVCDAYIPAILGVIGMALSVLWLLGTAPAADAQGWCLLAFTGIVQGVLVAGAAVYGNQIKKQHDKLREEELIGRGETDQN